CATSPRRLGKAGSPPIISSVREVAREREARAARGQGRVVIQYHHRAILWSALLLLSLAGCGRIQNERFVAVDAAQAPVRITIDFPQELRLDDRTEIEIRIENGAAPMSGAQVRVEGNMSHAGMEPLVASATEVAPGTYVAILDWTMAGEWSVTARASLPGGGIAERTATGLDVISR
ncbi:MAG: FixH family protein, partial [Ardenticatenaceae bacterium]